MLTMMFCTSLNSAMHVRDGCMAHRSILTCVLLLTDEVCHDEYEPGRLYGVGGMRGAGWRGRGGMVNRSQVSSDGATFAYTKRVQHCAGLPSGTCVTDFAAEYVFERIGHAYEDNFLYTSQDGFESYKLPHSNITQSLWLHYVGENTLMCYMFLFLSFHPMMLKVDGPGEYIAHEVPVRVSLASLRIYLSDSAK